MEEIKILAYIRDVTGLYPPRKVTQSALAWYLPGSEWYQYMMICKDAYDALHSQQKQDETSPCGEPPDFVLQDGLPSSGSVQGSAQKRKRKVTKPLVLQHPFLFDPND